MNGATTSAEDDPKGACVDTASASNDIEKAAAVLRHAQEQHEPCGLLPGELRPTSVAHAYDIQDAGVAAWAVPAGLLKTGLTSQAGLDMFGLDEPCYGQISQAGIHANGDELAAALFCQAPILECEFAVRIGADGAPDAAAAAIEVAAFRYVMTDGPKGLDLIADNVGATAVVLGVPVPLADAGDLEACGVSLEVNGEVQATGTGANIMGGPLASFERTIAHERSRGREPAPGTWIITGTASGMTPIVCGDSFSADFGVLGKLSASVGLPAQS